MRSGIVSASLVACGLFTAAPASAQGVKIGILNDQSGVYADYGGKYSLEAAHMAVEDFGGNVLGQKIEIISADHQNKPDLGATIARRWYDAEGVDMITELTTSSVALAVQELSKEKKKIDIVVGAATSRITGDACTPYSFHWAYDTRALAVGTGGALVKAGGDSWFFLTADYAFGYALEKDTAEIVTSNGGKVLGQVRVPLNSSDFSSFLLQAQSSKAKVIGLANAGLDTTNSIKQAAEFGSGGLFGLLAPYFLWTGVPEIGKRAPLLNAPPELVFQPRAAAFGAVVYMQRLLKAHRVDDIPDIKVGWASPSLLGSGRGSATYQDVRMRFANDAQTIGISLGDKSTIPPKLDASQWPGVLTVFAQLVGSLPKEVA